MLYIPTRTDSLRDVLHYYVNNISVAKRSYKTEVYRLKPLQEQLGDLTLPEITTGHCVAYRDKRLASPHPRKPGATLGTSTVKLELMLLSHVYTMAIAEWGMDDLINPVQRIRKPKSPPGRVRRLTTAEERNLLRAARQHSNREMYAIIVLAIRTAMRQGEILGLLWENVSWSKHTALLPMTKNGEVREIPLDDQAMAILQQHMQPKAEGRVFSYTSAGFKSSWRVLIRSLGIENLTFHDLRHHAISMMHEKGLSTIEVAAISGHKSMSMLKRYSHLLAWKLVAKLNPKPRRKSERAVLHEQLLPYPALVTTYSRQVIVDFPDFEDLRVVGRQEEPTLERAEALLLKTLVTLLCNGHEPPVPSPSTAIEVASRKSQVRLISPLGK
jgi:integrase